MVSLSLLLGSNVSLGRSLMALAWVPIEFAVIAGISSIFNEAFAVWTTYQLATETFAWSSKLSWLVACFGGSLALGLQGCLIGIYTDVLAELCFTRTPWFNAKRASLYPIRDRVVYHSHFVARVCTMFGVAFWIQPPTAHTWGTVPISHATMDPMGFVRRTGGPSMAWIVLLVAVQATLLLSDFLYYAWHYTQHHVKWTKVWSNHGLHHTFVFPLAEAGPWLSFADLLISGLLFLSLPVAIVTFAFQRAFPPTAESVASGDQYQALYFMSGLLQAYVHLMNHHCHVGKQLPLWSGCPLFPPLGFSLGLERSISNHEAHHNFNNCGYGLLSVADRLFGTEGFPRSDPRCQIQQYRKGADAEISKQAGDQAAKELSAYD